MSHIVGLNTWGECQLFDYMDYLEANGWFFITRSCSLVGWSSGKLLLCWLKYQASTVLNLKLIHFDLIALPLKCQWATYAKHIFRKDGGSSPEIQSQSWGMRNEKEKKKCRLYLQGTSHLGSYFGLPFLAYIKSNLQLSQSFAKQIMIMLSQG